MRAVKISLAFVGVVVGAGFATGQEIIQYFTSFGTVGLWSALLTSLVMIITGMVILQSGSYFLAKDHKQVFSNLSVPFFSVFVDWATIVALFGFGFVMFAGAGSTLEQEFGLPAWIGSGVMVVLVMISGMFDSRQVSGIIAWITPALVVTVVVAFIYTMSNVPEDFGVLDGIAREVHSPIEPWWLASVNYVCLALMTGLSMGFVIGGSTPSLKVAGWGGFGGGLLFTILLIMLTVIMFFNFEQIGGADVPMVRLLGELHPVMVVIMVLIVYGMIFNTALGMFYALGRRLTTHRRSWYKPVFLGTCLAGYIVSLAGFADLIGWVYPIIGYLGMIVVAVLVFWWIRHRREIRQESQRRAVIREMLMVRNDRNHEYTEQHAESLRSSAEASTADSTEITKALDFEGSYMRNRRG